MTATEVERLVRTELRRGDRVRLKSPEAIAATLDTDGRLDALPFMREMLEFADRDLVVEARADKTCDTINMTGPNRKMSGTVHIKGARCDGSAHGGCQAYCLLFFKEAWLEPVTDDVQPDSSESASPREDWASQASQESDLTLRLDGFAHPADNHYRCQATELLAASSPLTGRSHYLNDLRTRNVPLSKALRALPFALVNRFQRASQRLPSWLRIAGGRRFPSVRGRVVGDDWPDSQLLDLQPGDLVEVRSREEIEATLDTSQKNRGLWFDEEMLAYCGHRGKVRHRVERLIDEKTGRMLKIKRDLVVVEGMVGCTGVYHSLCPRSVIAMWREAWLRKVDPGE